MSERLAAWVYDHSEVWTSPYRMGGEPCLRGTRVPVETILGLLTDVELGKITVSGIHELYPAVEAGQIGAIFAAYANNGGIYE